MKKLSGFILSMIFLLAFSTGAFADHSVKIGYAFGADTRYGGVNRSVNAGLDIGYEYTVANGAFGNEALGYGLGVAYQFEKQQTDTANKFSYIPIYGLMTYDVGPVYLAGRLGYNLFNPNDAYENGSGASGGIYYAAGVGYQYGQLKMELLYEINSGTLGETVIDSAVTLKFGYTLMSNPPQQSAPEKLTAVTINGFLQKAADGVSADELQEAPALLRDFLMAVKNGTVSKTDLQNMRRQLSEVPDEEFMRPGNHEIGSFLAKVKSGSVTAEDLKNARIVLTGLGK